MELCAVCEAAPEEQRCEVCGMTGPEIADARLKGVRRDQ